MNLKGIKKLVIYGLTTLIGFNLFVACDYSTPYYPVITNDGESDELSPIVFNLNSEMSMDENGYYHVSLDTTKWQTTHRISGNVFRDDNPVNIIKFVWASSHHWLIGDDYGYIVSSGYTDDLVYVSYDTTYITGFNGFEVPIINGSSYSDEYGEVNIMIAPVKTMLGDTAAISYGYFDNWREEETYGSFNVIFD